jgi:L-lactate utilization protein LutB
MKEPVENYWQKRLNDLKATLEENNFEAHLAADTAEARKVVLQEILPKLNAESVSWGGSATFLATGLYEELKNNSGLEVLDAFDKSQTPRENTEVRRRGLLTDLFLTGTNAITETGILVNLDMVGNRVAAITFGPRHVIIFAGRNKIVADLEEAMYRVKNYAAPTNAMRLDKKTPCVETSYCEQCKSPDRICNYWTITERSFPKGRIKVVLINRDLGL